MEKMIDGVLHVWDVFENTWVTREYWDWANGQLRPTVRH